MKKLILSFLVAIMLSSSVWAAEMPTRAEFSAKLASVFDLSADSLFPLLRYNDWSRVDTSLRPMVAAAVKGGLFAPGESELQPDKTVDEADLDMAVFGILRYVSANESLHHYQGTVTVITGDQLTLNNGINDYITLKSSLYIENGLTDFSALKIAQKIDFVVNEQGKVLMGWGPQLTNKRKIVLKKAQLYLYDKEQDSLILKNISYYRDGQWIAEPNVKYENVKLSPSALVVSNGKRLRMGELNGNYLDQQVSVLIDADSQKIIYALIN